MLAGAGIFISYFIFQYRLHYWGIVRYCVNFYHTVWDKWSGDGLDSLWWRRTRTQRLLALRLSARCMLWYGCFCACVTVCVRQNIHTPLPCCRMWDLHVVQSQPTGYSPTNRRGQAFSCLTPDPSSTKQMNWSYWWPPRELRELRQGGLYRLQLSLQYDHSWHPGWQADWPRPPHLNLCLDHGFPHQPPAKGQSGLPLLLHPDPQHWLSSGLYAESSPVCPIHSWLQTRLPLHLHH